MSEEQKQETTELIDAEVVEEATRIAAEAPQGTIARASFGPLSTDSIIHDAVKSKADVEVMRELLAIRREERADIAREAFAQAMVQFRTAVQPIVRTGHRDDTKVKNRQNKFGTVKYDYCELGTTDDQIRPLLSQCQLYPAWKILKNEANWIEIECIVTHALRHSESSGPFGAPPSENTYLSVIQRRKATMTGLKRETLFVALGLVSEDEADDDGAGSGETPPKPGPRSRDVVDPAKQDAWERFAEVAAEKCGKKSLPPEMLRNITKQVCPLAGSTDVEVFTQWLSEHGRITDGIVSEIADPGQDDANQEGVTEGQEGPPAPEVDPDAPVTCKCGATFPYSVLVQGELGYVCPHCSSDEWVVGTANPAQTEQPPQEPQ